MMCNKLVKRGSWALFVLGLAVLLGPLGGAQGSFVSPMLAEAASPVMQGQVDVNKASVDELMQLNGIGPKTAENIIQYRQENGPFKSVEDLINVKGIGGKKLEGIRENIKL